MPEQPAKTCFQGFWLDSGSVKALQTDDQAHERTDDADAGEDKMEKMAAAKAQSIWDIAAHYTKAYWDDIKALNIRQPAQWTVAYTGYPRPE